jgi:hypothetical protein
MSPIDVLITGGITLLILAFVRPIVRGQKRDDGSVSKAVWLFVALLLVAVIAITIYSLTRPR